MSMWRGEGNGEIRDQGKERKRARAIPDIIDTLLCLQREAWLYSGRLHPAADSNRYRHP